MPYVVVETKVRSLVKSTLMLIGEKACIIVSVNQILLWRRARPLYINTTHSASSSRWLHHMPALVPSPKVKFIYNRAPLFPVGIIPPYNNNQSVCNKRWQMWKHRARVQDLITFKDWCSKRILTGTAAHVPFLHHLGALDLFGGGCISVGLLHQQPLGR